jgi:[ribosomal protein S5]-alanine N-acetyltransferase
MNIEQRFPVIETVRLKLRKPLQKDAKALLEITRDEIVMKYYGMQSFRSKSEAIDEINWFNKIFVQNEGVRWVIAEQGVGKYIGDIGFHNYKASHARAEIGFKLARAYWHQGIMAEALGQVLEYGFTVMQLNRIEAVVDPENTACLFLLKKARFVEEGILREYEHEAKGYVDLVMLSLLKKDYKASSRNENL